MNVLSLFDGISCGQLALKKLGIKVDNYYASEIDKYTLAVTAHYFPSTIQLGDVTTWSDWDIDWSSVDLIIGDSPCQSFSRSGDGSGFDGKSKLFFDFVDILNHVRSFNPSVQFLLENVRMKKEWRDVISSFMGVEPISINSALVSAQNRRRLYWTNIPNVTQPTDLGLVLNDILEDDVTGYDLSDKAIKRLLNIDGTGFKSTVKTGDMKSATVLASVYKLPRGMNIIGPRVIHIKEEVKVRKHTIDKEHFQFTIRKFKDISGLTINDISIKLGDSKSKIEHYFRTDDSFAYPDPDIWLKIKELLGIITDEFDLFLTEFIIKDSVFDMGNRVYDPDYKSPTITTSGNVKIVGNVQCINPRKQDGSQTYQQDRIYNSDGKMTTLTSSLGGRFNIDDHITYRKLTPTECERLQTLPDDYTLIPWQTRMMSNSQRYKMIGNGWTVDVIKHIFKNLLTLNT